jgi:hypothetical protein
MLRNVRSMRSAMAAVAIAPVVTAATITPFARDLLAQGIPNSLERRTSALKSSTG